MTQDPHKYDRIFAIAPSSRGFGYALLEGERLVKWGVTSATGDKNIKCVTKVEELILHFEPEVMVLEDTGTEPTTAGAELKPQNSRSVV